MVHLRRWPALLLGFVSLFSAFDAHAANTPAIRYQEFRLKNGLVVILSEDHRLPLVSVNLWYHVGPADEVPGRTGFAHLFEHMMFEGSEHVGAKAHFRYLEAAGGTDINASTAFDRTNYFETVPANQLELALWLESDRMGFLLPTLDQEKLTNQRDVVRNERRQTTENVPYGLVEEGVYHQLFPQGHPYYGAVIGSHRDIESARLNDIRQFFREYYVPNNASLTIVGDFKPEQARAWVEKYFATLPAGPHVPKQEIRTPVIRAERRAVFTDQVQLPRVYMAWITPPAYKPGDAECNLLADILGGGKSSRLYRKLVYEKQIAQDVNVDYESLSLGSVFEIEATARPGVKPEDLERAIDEELAVLRNQGPSQAELVRARNTTEAGMVHELESLNGVADRLNRYQHYLGDPGYLPHDLATYDQITLADLGNAAREQLKPTARVVVYGVPGKKVIDDVPRTRPADEASASSAGFSPVHLTSEAWRSIPPKPGPTPKVSAPVAVHFSLKNGLSVYLTRQSNLPVIAADLVILDGADQNPRDKPGLASYTTRMLMEGTEHRGSLELADEIDRLGLSLDADSDYDSATVSLWTLSKNTSAAFDLLGDVALHPAFRPEEIERLRQQRLTYLIQSQDNGGMLRNRVMERVLYGDTPYAYDIIGTPASNRTMTREDLRQFWKSGFVPSNAALVLAGDLTESQARTLAEKYFGTWTGTPFSRLTPSFSSLPKTSRAIYIVDKPGAPQTSLTVAGIGPARNTPDYVPLEVMNLAFGGAFSSRINMNLREVHGYTYGAQSRFSFRRGPGPFQAMASIRTNVTAPAVHELFLELDRVRSGELSPEELKAAKSAYALSLTDLFETSGTTADTVAGMFVYHLPSDYYQTLPTHIEAVTAADVLRVAKTYLRPEDMAVVAVGDRSRIESELKSLNLGPVEDVAPGSGAHPSGKAAPGARTRP